MTEPTMLYGSVGKNHERQFYSARNGDVEMCLRLDASGPSQKEEARMLCLVTVCYVCWRTECRYVLRSSSLDSLKKPFDTIETEACRSRERHASYHLRFADEIVLITPNIEQAEQLLAEFDNACERIGLNLNLTKTISMRNGLVPDAPSMLNERISLNSQAMRI
uniref:Reverse transcriptase domain-containing protein n=1 Tax=Haemonchus contortus TaxID=6289 RepID=A0A7I5E5K0_HAECO